MVNIVVSLYGAFRRYGNGRNIELILEKECSVAQIRKMTLEKLQGLDGGFKEFGLLQDSVFANNQRILGESDFVKPGDTLAILPPVCGG